MLRCVQRGPEPAGASALVHLDLPTTLRVVEQRVGRVDRMNSLHDVIEVWWPRDSPAFATRSHDVLVRRATESAQLLGSNLAIPDLGSAPTERLVEVEDQIAIAEASDAEPWDGIRDALDPVRHLVSEDDPLLPSALYAELRQTHHRVLARVSPVHAQQPWGSSPSRAVQTAPPTGGFSVAPASSPPAPSPTSAPTFAPSSPPTPNPTRWTPMPSPCSTARSPWPRSRN